jgi:hypothetical protein
MSKLALLLLLPLPSCSPVAGYPIAYERTVSAGVWPASAGMNDVYYLAGWKEKFVWLPAPNFKKGE